MIFCTWICCHWFGVKPNFVKIFNLNQLKLNIVFLLFSWTQKKKNFKHYLNRNVVVFDKLPLRQFNTEQFSIWTFKSIKESNKFPFVKISDKKEFPRPLCYSKTPSGRYMLMKSIFNYFNHWFLVLVWFNLFKRKKIEKLNSDTKFSVLYYSKYFKIHSCIVVKYTV